MNALVELPGRRLDRDTGFTAPPTIGFEGLDEPVERRSGWIVIFLFFAVLLGFAAFISLDAAAYAEGTITVSGNRQTVQHRDGGIVAALNVVEGQKVEAGDVLIELAGAEVAANEAATAAQVIHLLAERERLRAEQAGRGSVPAPPEFATLDKEYQPLARDALALQQSELNARRSSVAAQKSILNQQAAQLRQRISGLGQQIESNQVQARLFDDEIEGMEELAERGFASRNRVRALQRSNAAVDGETASLAASAASAREQIGEVQMQSLSLDRQRMEEVSLRLSETIDELGEALPRWNELRRQRESLLIRSPATGQVVGLRVFTVGGVVPPGEKLMDVVPDRAELVIEMKVAPEHADDVRVGQAAEVRFAALHDTTLPVFEGEVTRISADSFVDENTGLRYFTGEVTMPPDAIETIERSLPQSQLRAGLPVEVLIPLRERTLLNYLIEPLTRAIWRSGREQ